MAEKRLAVVTGAARGIGRAIVLELLAQGRRVAALDIIEDNLKDLTEVAAVTGKITFKGEQGDAKRLDLSSDPVCVDGNPDGKARWDTVGIRAPGSDDWSLIGERDWFPVEVELQRVGGVLPCQLGQRLGSLANQRKQFLFAALEPLSLFKQCLRLVDPGQRLFLLLLRDVTAG